MLPSSSPIEISSDTESDDSSSTLSGPTAERFTSSLCTQAEVNALCKKHGVPTDFSACPAGERRACSPPPPGAFCVYAHALEAGLRFPLNPFFSEALSHFGLAPSQLTPNGWRVLVAFVVRCHTADVPPSVAVFRHFFSLRRRGWYGFRCKKGAGVLFTGLTSPKSEKEWKRAFFFLTSPEPWLCPVHWGEPPSKISTAPVLSSEENKSVAKLVHAHGPAVDLRAYLSQSNLAAVFSSNLAVAPPPPSLLAPSPRSTGSQGMDLSDAAVSPAAKVKAEPVGDSPQLSGKKRKQEDIASALRRSKQNTPPAAPPGIHAPPLPGCSAPDLPAPDTHDGDSAVPDTHDGDSAGWQEAQKILQCIITPSREREFAAAKPSDVVKSTYLAMHQAVNYAWFSAGYALELDEKQKVQERDAAALREQLEEAKAELAAAKQASEVTLKKARAELEKARAELESARRDAEAEVSSW